MRLLVCPLAATVCLAFLGATPRPAPKPKVEPQVAISEADVRATIAHMQTLARDQEDRLSVADRLNAADAETIKNQALKLQGVDAQLAAVQKAKNNLDAAIGTLNKNLAAERWAKWKAVIFGWPVVFVFGVAGGLALAVFLRLGTKAAVAAGEVALKGATGI